MTRPTVVLSFLLLCAAGCGDDSTATATRSVSEYRDAGAYAAGVTTMQLADRELEIWYPVALADVEGLARDQYFIRDWLPDFVQALLAPDVNPPFEQDAYRDAPASGEGPFPLVLFAHGAASYRNQSTFLTAHLATWGFVVASIDYLERGLSSALGGGPETPIDDAELSRMVVDFLAAENDGDGSPLQGRISTDQIAITGHSAGGGTARRFGGEDDVVTFIPLSAGVSSNPDVMTELPDRPSMWLTGDIDDIVQVERVEAAYEAAPPPKRLVLIQDMGHLGPSDICAIGNEGGGVIQIAIDSGLGDLIPEGFRRLGTDGCQPEAVSPQDGWPAVNLFVTAQLRAAFGLDPQPGELGADGAAALPEVTITFREELQ